MGSLYFQECWEREFTMGALSVSRRTVPPIASPRPSPQTLKSINSQYWALQSGKKKNKYELGTLAFWRVTQHGEIRVELWLCCMAFSPCSTLLGRESACSHSESEYQGVRRVGALQIEEEGDQGNPHLVQRRGQSIQRKKRIKTRKNCSASFLQETSALHRTRQQLGSI